MADAYVNGLRAGRMLKVAESHVESLAAHARDVENLREQGMVARSDLLSARVALADARQKALQAAKPWIWPGRPTTGCWDGRWNKRSAWMSWPPRLANRPWRT